MSNLFGKTGQQRGSAAEQQAQRHLEGNGLQRVAHNVRSRFGEIDLVMRHANTLVFVEVRYRSHSRFGGALASVDHHKQRRLIATAQHYLLRHPHDGPCRFDVVGIGGDGNDIEWLQNAFQLSE